MVSIKASNVNLEIPIFGMYSNSLKRTIIDKVTNIKQENITTKTSSLTILKNINLNLKEGDKIALVGTNGAGKTTFLKLLAGIYKDYTGDLVINGSVANLLDMYSCVSAEASGVENVYLKAYSMGFKKEYIDSKIDEIIEFSELGKFANMPIKTYSAGMRVRILCSLILCVHQEIILIDEGIMAGDNSFILKMKNKLNEIFAKSKIFIIASHNETLINDLGLKKIEIKNGFINI